MTGLQEAGTSDSAFEDEESHTFYEVLPELQGLVPAILLQDTSAGSKTSATPGASTALCLST